MTSCAYFDQLKHEIYFTPVISRSLKILAGMILDELILELVLLFYKTLVRKGCKLQHMYDYILSEMFCLF